MAKGKSLTVAASANATFGTILVSGTTLYPLMAGEVACTAQCRHHWHQVDLPKGVKMAKAGHGVSSAKSARRSGAGVSSG